MRGVTHSETIVKVRLEFVRVPNQVNVNLVGHHGSIPQGQSHEDVRRFSSIQESDDVIDKITSAVAGCDPTVFIE